MGYTKEMRNKDNALNIHRNHGTIQLHINNIMVRSSIYTNKTHRQELIDRWRYEYPPRKNQERVFVIKPNWDKYIPADEPIEKIKTATKISRTDHTDLAGLRNEHIYIN